MERMEMHIISEQPVPLPDCPKREWIFLKIDLFFRLMTTVSHPPTKNNWEHQTSISCHLPMHARWILLCALTAICSLGSVSPGLHHCRDLFFSRVQDFASILVEFHNVPVVSFLQTVSVPMAGSPTPQYIAWSIQLGVIENLVRGHFSTGEAIGQDRFQNSHVNTPVTAGIQVQPGNMTLWASSSNQALTSSSRPY